MKLIVNGEDAEVDAVDARCRPRRARIAEAKVATALNGEFVPARAREATPVKDGDRIEIVAPRQGG